MSVLYFLWIPYALSYSLHIRNENYLKKKKKKTTKSEQVRSSRRQPNNNSVHLHKLQLSSYETYEYEDIIFFLK